MKKFANLSAFGATLPGRIGPDLMAFVLLVFIGLSAGCSHVWRPETVPEIGTDAVGPYTAKYSVDLINDEPDKTPRLFAAAGVSKHYANYHEWTEFFIDDYSKELTRRGVAVSAQSPNKIKVKLSNFAYFQSLAKARVNMTVTLASADDRWSKTYHETDTSGLSLGRAFGSIIYHTVEKLLKDPELLGKMKAVEQAAP